MRLPGEVFNANVQCQLKFGPKSQHSALQSGRDICTDLHCTKDHYTWASHAALEGTSCGPEQVPPYYSLFRFKRDKCDFNILLYEMLDVKPVLLSVFTSTYVC